MALIKCSECGKEFSDKAEACPNCGCPTEMMTEADRGESESKKDEAVKVDDSTEDEAKTVHFPDEEEKAYKKKKNLNIGIIAVVVIAIVGAATFFTTANSRKYSLANSDFNSNKFDSALDKYTSLGDYKDSKEKAEKCKYELTVDGQFMRALSEGLMARWDKSEQDEANGNFGEDPDRYAAYCDTELEQVGKFEEETFDNEKLGEDAKTYIELLNKAKDSTKYYTIDYNTYFTQWDDVYAQRTILLNKFIDDHGLEVDESHQKTLDGLMVDASAAAEQAEAKEKIHAITNDFKLVATEDGSGYTSYKLQMKNTTEFTFDYFYVEISIVNSDGNIIDTGSASQVSTWTPDQEAEVDAYVNNQTSLDGNTIQYTPHYSTGTLYE